MINCHSDILKFYKDEVRLGTKSLEDLEKARKTCASNVESGLKTNGDPSPEKFVSQGSFAMETVVQHPENDYDIDHGIVFGKAALVGPRGADKAPRDARQMVADAFKDGRFDSDPKVKKNCVRFPYVAGYHVDMPVYRSAKDWLGTTYYEIASGDEWKHSDPEAVTKWFKDAVKAKSPNMSDDGQMRRIVCLLKAVEKTRSSYNWPSGFIVSVLVKDRYVSDDRDDVSFIKTIRSIVSRLNAYTSVRHPVVDESLADEGDTAVVWMRDKLADFEAKFVELEDEECSRGRAMQLWDQIFGTDWFSKRIAEKAATIGFTATSVAASAPYQRPTDGNRWGSGRSG